MRRKVIGIGLLAALLFVSSAMADRSLRYMSSVRTALRPVNAGNAQQFDTLAAFESGRVEIQNFCIYGDDSATVTPTLELEFMSLNSHTVYLRLSDTYTAAQLKTTCWPGPFIFPKDSTILVYYNLLTAGTLDTLRAYGTYKLERP